MEERFLKLERDYRALRRYAAAMTLGVAVLSGSRLFTFDQYNQDETLTLGYTDRNGRRRVVLVEPTSRIVLQRGRRSIVAGL